MKEHKIFSKFLNGIVDKSSGQGDAFIDIRDIQDRFQSLKNDNVELLERKKKIEENQKIAKGSTGLIRGVLQVFILIQ